MEDFASFGSRSYSLLLLALLAARAMDFLSTWVATPNLVLEGNPLAKRLGWKWGIPVNIALCFGFAFWPFPAIVISVTSFLVAARNFQSAWLMRSMGEEHYREWHIQRLQETRITLFLSCLFAQTFLFGGVGAGVVFFASRGREPNTILAAIGLGVVGYAAAVTFYTLLGVWRLRRATLHRERFPKREQPSLDTAPVQANNGKPSVFFEPPTLDNAGS